MPIKSRNKIKKSNKVRKGIIFSQSIESDIENNSDNIYNEEEITNSEIDEVIKNNYNEDNQFDYLDKDDNDNNDINLINNNNNFNDLNDIYKILNSNNNSKVKENDSKTKVNCNHISINNEGIKSNNQKDNINNVNNNIIQNIINQKYILNDLKINVETKVFTYRNKDYYLYTPKKQRNCNKLTWKCKLYRSNEIKLKGSRRLCYGQISLYKDSNKIYLEKTHSEYYNNIIKNIPDNIVDINDEINKKYKLEEILLDKI